ncbi:YfcZ/YiiS family protein [Vibrio furnissii]|uniref:YfcZ/YiiS family protein n=1 Tax=Vibrio furnissii TaxID=29494 RepID=UPI0015591C06|nr:YfcZ/YiiS family protein [Vibrio furnissii]
MSNESYVETEVCEACGVAGEMGYIIREGDDVAEVTIFADNSEQLNAELEKYLAVAKQVNENVQHEVLPLADDAKELHARFQFEVSAEKLIFELKTRSLAR